MATRTNVNSIRPKSSGEERLVVPWEASGIFTASAVIKDKPGLLGGVIVTVVGEGTADSIKVWDSPDADTTGDVELTRVTLAAGTNLGQQAIVMFPSPGVYAQLGIYVEMSSGAVLEYELYYR
jgi:hypothetical protein